MAKGTRDGATGGEGLGNEAVDETSAGKSVAAYSQADRGKVIVATGDVEVPIPATTKSVDCGQSKGHE